MCRFESLNNRAGELVQRQVKEDNGMQLLDFIP